MEPAWGNIIDRGGYVFPGANSDIPIGEKNAEHRLTPSKLFGSNVILGGAFGLYRLFNNMVFPNLQYLEVDPAMPLVHGGTQS